MGCGRGRKGRADVFYVPVQQRGDELGTPVEHQSPSFLPAFLCLGVAHVELRDLPALFVARQGGEILHTEMAGLVDPQAERVDDGKEDVVALARLPEKRPRSSHIAK